MTPATALLIATLAAVPDSHAEAAFCQHWADLAEVIAEKREGGVQHRHAQQTMLSLYVPAHLNLSVGVVDSVYGTLARHDPPETGRIIYTACFVADWYYTQ